MNKKGVRKREWAGTTGAFLVGGIGTTELK